MQSKEWSNISCQIAKVACIHLKFLKARRYSTANWAVWWTSKYWTVRYHLSWHVCCARKKTISFQLFTRQVTTIRVNNVSRMINFTRSILKQVTPVFSYKTVASCLQIQFNQCTHQGRRLFFVITECTWGWLFFVSVTECTCCRDDKIDTIYYCFFSLEQVIKMVCLMLVAFIVCWVPLQVVVLYSQFSHSSDQGEVSWRDKWNSALCMLQLDTGLHVEAA